MNREDFYDACLSIIFEIIFHSLFVTGKLVPLAIFKILKFFNSGIFFSSALKIGRNRYCSGTLHIDGGKLRRYQHCWFLDLHNEPTPVSSYWVIQKMSFHERSYASSTKMKMHYVKWELRGFEGEL